ncbi:SRPBCC domain-containing protein [Bacillus sp. FJAT-49711]|uniref:SRPBCC family protein n=1 Tax=Bacillus sp. FJAT-49711 TaxID=2833585 RepID=UPI0032D5A8DE
MRENVVGQTKAVGFQIGVRRTFPISHKEAWKLITSKEVLSLWLGNVKSFPLQKGETFSSEMGKGEIRVIKPLQQIRLTWQKEKWEKTSTVQIRILHKEENKTTISFHQEHLSDESVREEMKELWEKVLNLIKEQIESAE